MAYKIIEDCINCDACLPECPNGAIYKGGDEWRFSDGTDLKGMIEVQSVSVDADAPQTAKADDYYYIVSEKCTECVGFFDEPRCVSVCPVDCCIADTDFVETPEVLLAKQQTMHLAA